MNTTPWFMTKKWDMITDVIIGITVFIVMCALLGAGLWNQLVFTGLN